MAKMNSQEDLFSEKHEGRLGRIFTKKATGKLIKFMDEILGGETDLYRAAIYSAEWGEYLQAGVNKVARHRIDGQIIKGETRGDVTDWLHLVHDLVEKNGHGGSPLAKGIVSQ